LAPMFPSGCRKGVPSLYRLSMRGFLRVLMSYISGESGRWGDRWGVSRVRRYTRQHLPAHILTHILSSLTPAARPSSGLKFTFPCTDRMVGERLECRIHPQCQLLFNHAPSIIRVLLSEDIDHLSLDFKKIKIESYKEVMLSLYDTMTKEPRRPFPNLRRLVLCGGTVHSDDLLPRVEELCDLLRLSARNLDHLHLPVASNLVFRSCSEMESLSHLHVDRTRKFQKRGLFHMCHPDSRSRQGLRVLHIGVYRHKHFEKQDVSNFLNCMRNLEEISFLDRERAKVRLDGSRSPGDKVLTYSVFKFSKKDKEPKEWVNSPHMRFVTNLKSLLVVDRSLKPRYLLESAPRLSELAIDWQEELCLPPFQRYKAAWFSEMLRGQSWLSLGEKLSKLDLTFPATYSINSYSLPLEDFTLLMESIPNVKELRLEGGGGGAPLPLIPILFYCPSLLSLVLEKCPVHVPDNYEVINTRCVSRTLKRFYFLGEMSSLLVHDFMMRGISAYMPLLEELEVQPSSVLGYSGLKPAQVRELSSLHCLQRLSIPLSIRECIMNLPEVIYILRDFPSLRFLTLSWGMLAESYDISKGKIASMMQWLLNALDAENANIHLQLSYKHHPQEYTSGPVQYNQNLQIHD